MAAGRCGRRTACAELCGGYNIRWLLRAIARLDIRAFFLRLLALAGMARMVIAEAGFASNRLGGDHCEAGRYRSAIAMRFMACRVC